MLSSKELSDFPELIKPPAGLIIKLLIGLTRVRRTQRTNKQKHIQKNPEIVKIF